MKGMERKKLPDRVETVASSTLVFRRDGQCSAVRTWDEISSKSSKDSRARRDHSRSHARAAQEAMVPLPNGATWPSDIETELLGGELMPTLGNNIRARVGPLALGAPQHVTQHRQYPT